MQCPACWHENPAQAKFCLECGARVTASEAVVVPPIAHEDHAVRACYAALRMQASVNRYAEDARRAHGVTVQIRVGMNSGEVVVRAMKRLSFSVPALLLLAFVVAGCAHRAGDGWVTLIDGETGLDNWNRIGDANWRAAGGAITADRGKGGYLVSKNAYKDFVIVSEFWAATDTNSGVFIRCADPTKVGAPTCYEVNIWDIRPDPMYATGGIVDHAAVPVPLVHKAGGRWNTYEITAKGPQLTVKLNGVQTVSIQDGKHASGPFALQYGPGVKGAPGGPIKWRKVQIRPL